METRARSIQQIVDQQVKKWEIMRRKKEEEKNLPVITVSREPGSRGRLVAEGIADQLGFDLFHREIILEMAKNAQISSRLLESLDEKGLDNGEGFTINIPLPASSGDTAFAAILERIISPAADRFKPDAILISAGFDAHWRDPLASLQLTTRGFYTLGRGFNKLADEHCESRLIYVLEGGYDPEALAENVQAILFSLTEGELMGEPLGSPPHPDADANAIIDEVIRIHNL